MQYLLAAIIGCSFLCLLSFNSAVWLEAGLALLVSIALVYRQQRTYPALMWALGINWLGIVGAIATADLQGMNFADTIKGPSHVEAVQLSLVSLIVFAAGIASGLGVASKQSKLVEEGGAESFEYVIDLRRGMITYFGALIVAEIGVWFTRFIPQLQQQFYMLQMLKFACIYLVATAVFSTGRGYLWLSVMLAIEVVTGMTGYFGAFKEGFFIVFIALLATGQRSSKRIWVFGTTAAICLVMLSLVWTSVKKDYRHWVSGNTGEQIVARSFHERANWMLDHISLSNIDYSRALRDMTERVDNTEIYALYLARADAGYVVDLPSRYLGAFKNILMPRILFPDKGVINDSYFTRAMTGLNINNQTSISMGYIAEAQYDFGIPLMFVPIFIIGMVVALAGRYFMNREVPYVIRQAFATTVLFNSLMFGSNFDKALGGFLMELIVLALVLRFAYPPLAGWLAGRRRMPKRLLRLSARNETSRA